MNRHIMREAPAPDRSPPYTVIEVYGVDPDSPVRLIAEPVAVAAETPPAAPLERRPC